MSYMTRLPKEIIEIIYHNLGSIDDVHHFGRACKATYDVIRRQTMYNSIMRSVIGNSPSGPRVIAQNHLRPLDYPNQLVSHAKQPSYHFVPGGMWAIVGRGDHSS